MITITCHQKLSITILITPYFFAYDLYYIVITGTITGD